MLNKVVSQGSLRHLLGVKSSELIFYVEKMHWMNFSLCTAKLVTYIWPESGSSFLASLYNSTESYCFLFDNGMGMSVGVTLEVLLQSFL